MTGHTEIACHWLPMVLNPAPVTHTTATRCRQLSYLSAKKTLSSGRNAVGFCRLYPSTLSIVLLSALFIENGCCTVVESRRPHGFPSLAWNDLFR
jgi:hypothetical protein